MRKNIFIIYYSLIFFLLIIPLVLSYEQSNTDYNVNISVISSGGTNQTNINLQVNSLLGINAINQSRGSDTVIWGFFYYVIEEVEEIISSGRPSGEEIITLYYDVIVDVLKDKYLTSDTVKANITIINRGYEPDRDGFLVSYLLSPNNIRYREKSREFELVPPTCPDGTYDRYKDICTYLGRTYEPKKLVMTREMSLPEDTELGEWKFYVEYQTRVQPLIKVADSFEVITEKKGEVEKKETTPFLSLLSHSIGFKGKPLISLGEISEGLRNFLTPFLELEVIGNFTYVTGIRTWLFIVIVAGIIVLLYIKILKRQQKEYINNRFKQILNMLKSMKK